jgi:hypothetical protein
LTQKPSNLKSNNSGKEFNSNRKKGEGKSEFGKSSPNAVAVATATATVATALPIEQLVRAFVYV